jgi:hypothetical protein
MPSLVTLSSLANRAGYVAHFMNPALWKPYVQQVCAWHGFSCIRIEPGVPGTFPTFIVEAGGESLPQSNQTIVVKFFGPLFEGYGSFCVERDIGQWLERQSMPISSPKILAEGRLDNDWQYLIFEYIDGVSIGQLRQKLSANDWRSIACQMGEYIRALHAQTVQSQPELPRSVQPCLENFTGFIAQQRLHCQAHHQEWNDLPAQLLDQIEGFILPVEQLIDFSAPPHLIHADLTMDHLLGCLMSGGWKSLAVIDWGDAMTGNILYELVSLYLDLFQSDMQLLKVCLDAYGLSDFYQHDFPWKALSMVLLHQFPLPTRVYAPYIGVKSLQELAEYLFAV